MNQTNLSLTESIEDFLKTDISILILDSSQINGDLKDYVGITKDDPIINQKFIEHDFELSWNGMPPIHSNLSFKEPRGYKHFLSDKKKEARQKFSMIPELDISEAKKFELLVNIRSDVTSIIKNFFVESINYCGFHYDFYNSKSLHIKYSSDKRISEIDVKRIIHSYYVLQKNYLENLLDYINAYLDVFKHVGFNSTQALKKSERTRDLKTEKKKSFKLINEKYFDTGAFENFKSSLEDQENSLIEKTNIRNFKKVFNNEIVEEKINWLDDENSLFYFIRRLREKNKIEKHTPCWPIVANCFVLKGSTINPFNMARCHPPKDANIKNKVNRCIEFLS